VYQHILIELNKYDARLGYLADTCFKFNDPIVVYGVFLKGNLNSNILRVFLSVRQDTYELDNGGA
jgi:hypothetical protein